MEQRMIKSFADKETEILYITGKSKKFSAAVCNVGLRKLDYLNGAKTLNDLRASPGNRLEALKGKYAGKYSIRINDQFRVIFRFMDPDAYEVEIKDYH
jgi:proteic killer suppression protein